MIACDGSKTKEHNSDFVIRLEERPHIGNKIWQLRSVIFTTHNDVLIYN